MADLPGESELSKPQNLAAIDTHINFQGRDRGESIATMRQSTDLFEVLTSVADERLPQVSEPPEPKLSLLNKNPQQYLGEAITNYSTFSCERSTKNFEQLLKKKASC